jgi:hypothetical protein
LRTRYFLVIAAFIVCLVLLIITRQSISGEFKIHHIDFYDNGDDWTSYKFDNVILNQYKTGLLLESPDRPGFITSPPLKTRFDFDEILLSWNCLASDPGGLFISLSVGPDSNTWYEFAYQQWGNLDTGSIRIPDLPQKIADIGRLDFDIIRLKQTMKYYRFKIICAAGADKQFILDRVSVCYSNISANMRQYNVFSPAMPEIEPIALAVPYKSQHWLPDSIAGLTCSPTSVTMVLNYYNRDFSHLEVAGVVYDQLNDIYGNWPYNAQAAYLLGMKKTWVGRHNSFNELVDELKAGRPVIISIAFDEDQKLAGAPYKSTDGHLIVVRGFDNNGHVLVNDPAGDNIGDGVNAYNIDELTAVWTGHQGVAYHLWPE